MVIDASATEGNGAQPQLFLILSVTVRDVLK